MTDITGLLPARPLNGSVAVALLLLNLIVGRIFRNQKEAPPRFFYLAGMGWAANLLYLVIDEWTSGADGAAPSIPPTVRTLAILWLNIATYVCFLGAARWQSAKLRRLLRARRHLVYLFLVLAVVATGIVGPAIVAPYIVALVIVVGAVAIGMLAFAYRELFRYSTGSFPRSIKMLVVAPLGAYAVLQLGAFAAPPYYPDAAHHSVRALLLVGALLKLAHLLGLLGYSDYLRKEYEQRAYGPDPALIRRIAEQLSHELLSPALELRLIAGEMEKSAKHDSTVAAAQRSVEQVIGATSSFQEYLDDHRSNEAQRVTHLSLNVACDQAVVSVKAILPTPASVTFPRDFAPGLYVVVVASELQQVLKNLVKNGVESVQERTSSTRKPAVVVRTREHREDGRNFADVYVADSGAGVAPAIRVAIFEDGYSTKRARGRGHGLYIASRLTQKLGGTLVLLDSPDETLGGAVFRVRLPAAQVKQPHTATGA